MPQGNRSDINSNIFYSWSMGSIAGFWLITALILAAIPLLNLPVGIAFFLLIFLLPLVWKDPDKEDVVNGMMVRDTIPWKIATFMNILKGPYRRNIFELDDLLGVGPPEDDMFTGVNEHWFRPATRLSAYFSMTFAFCLSFLDWLVRPILYPVWGSGEAGATIPVVVCQVFSFIFFYAALQALNTTRRYHKAIELTGVEKLPAVMWSKLPPGKRITAKDIPGCVIPAIIVTALFLGSVVIVYMIIEKPLPWMWISLISLMLGVTVGLHRLFAKLTHYYREEFMFQVERRDAWNGIWGYKNDLIPYMEMEVPVPGEPGKPGGPPEDYKGEIDPHVWVATFAFPVNGTFGKFSEDADMLKPSLGDQAAMLAIAPIPISDKNTGSAIPGTVSSAGFRVWWSDENVTLHQLLEEPDITPEQKEIAVRANIVDPIAQIKQIKRCIVHSHSMMTAPDSKVNIMKVTLVPSKGITESDFINNLGKIEQALGVKWVRAKRNTDSNGLAVIELYLGNGSPMDEGIIYPKGIASSKYKNRLMSVHWEYVFSVNKITSPQGSPSMIMSRNITDKSEEIVFNLPAGNDMSEIKRKSDLLKSTSGNGYMEVHEGIPSKKQFSRRENREIEKYMKNNTSTAQFTVVASKTHPLEDVFLFSKYKNQLITGREPGVLKSSWSPGVKSNGTLAKHDFFKDDPHLVLAGSSGSGKSALIYSMLSQLMANNSPEELLVWIIDPKIGFDSFQFIDNTTRYVDQWTPKEGYFYEACRDLLSDACKEMERRNKIFRYARNPDGSRYQGDTIDKLAVARRIGIEMGPMADGSPNPLVQPMIVIIIDECALLFTDAPDKETKALQKEILFYAARLARESRSAGIHCLFSTQYPTTTSLPSIIKQQSARIGLMTQDNIASRVIIDQDGLEELYIKGTGKVKEGRNYVDFRGFLMEEDSFDEHSMSEILGSLPKRNPDIEIDGEESYRFLTGSSATQSGGESTPQGRIVIEKPDSSIFAQWDKQKNGTAQALRGLTKPQDDADGKPTKTGSKADKIRSPLDILEKLDLGDDDPIPFNMEETKKILEASYVFSQKDFDALDSVNIFNLNDALKDLTVDQVSKLKAKDIKKLI